MVYSVKNKLPSHVEDVCKLINDCFPDDLWVGEYIKSQKFRIFDDVLNIKNISSEATV